MSRWQKILGLAVTTAIVITVFAALWVQSYLTSPVTVSDGGTGFVILPGTSFGEVANRLEQAGITCANRQYSIPCLQMA